MKKTKLIPIGVAACLSFGIYSAVASQGGLDVSASVRGAADTDGVLSDLVYNGLKSLTSQKSEKESVKVNTDVMYTASADAVEITDDSKKEAADKTEVNAEPEKADDSIIDAVSAPEDVPDAAGEILTEEADVQSKAEAVTEESTYDVVNIAEELSDIIEAPAVDNSTSADKEDLKTLQEEIKPVSGQEPSEEEAAEAIADVIAESEEDNATADERNDEADAIHLEDEAAHEHTWTPVYETVHHDAVTHIDEVLVYYTDGNSSKTYHDEDGNDICNVFTHGITAKYIEDEFVSAEGEETAGTIEISNYITGEKFVFAPGELEDADSFVIEMFGDKLATYRCSYLIGPAWPGVEKIEIVDKEAYDEEVLTGHICEECGETK